MNACTIITANYLAQAKVLADSFFLQQPGGRFFLLVVDGLPESEQLDERIELLAPEQVEIDDFYGMCFRYSVVEICTAVKPSLLRWLLTEYGLTNIVYFDPDIRLMRRLTELEHALAEGTIVLTPHLLAPIPLDGKKPSEQDILSAGSYNLGFLGLRASDETSRFLEWWISRLKDNCVVDIANGLFVDQKWVDLAPSLFPGARLLLDPAYNVAYWNLHARELTEQDGSYFSEGRPLGFFHYSGYDPTKPDQLSKHQTRNRIIRGSALDKLLAEYRELLFAAGYERSSKYRYRLSTFSDGTRLSPLFRRLYASLTPEQQQRLGNPFQVDAEPSFFRWALQPVGKRPGPFFELILRQRPEIAASYPDPLGRHKSGFRTWLERVGANEMGFEPALARYLDGNAEEAVPQRPVLPCGVNLCGYIRNETGLGRVARGFAQSLRAAELPYSLIDVSHMSVNRSQDRSLTDDGTKDEYSIGLMVVNADQTVEVMRELGPERFAGKYNIGFWNWELPEFPRQWRERLDLFDEIWMGSRFGAEAVQRLSKTPVRVVLPPLYRSERGDRERGRQLLKAAANDYVFLTIFDFHSYAERKNPRGLIEAFKLAFPQPDNARLVIKCVNEQSNQVEMEALRQLAVGVRVDFLSGYLEAAQVDDLMAGCDAYVSLHRSEGIGLTLSDAMSAGKPTIATGWSGNMEFMTEQTSLLVRYRLVKLEANVGPYEAGSTWAEPDLSHAAELMQQLASDPESGRRLGAAARQYMQTEFGLEASASRVGERLRAICAITADPETTWRPRDLSWLQGDATMSHMDDQYSLDRQDGLIRVPYLPEFDSKSSLFGPVGRIVKRAVTFLTAYHTYYQKRVNISFISFMRESAGLHEKQVESSQEMEQQLDELKARVASLEKELARRNG